MRQYIKIPKIENNKPINIFPINILQDQLAQLVAQYQSQLISHPSSNQHTSYPVQSCANKKSNQFLISLCGWHIFRRIRFNLRILKFKKSIQI